MGTRRQRLIRKRILAANKSKARLLAEADSTKPLADTKLQDKKMTTAPEDKLKLSPDDVNEGLVMIKFDEICNLGYTPISLHTNPLYKIARDFLANGPSEKKTRLVEYYKMIASARNLSDLMLAFSSEPRKINPLTGHKSDVAFIPWSMKNPKSKNYFVKHWQPFTALHKEETRLLIILESMKKSGYRPKDFIGANKGYRKRPRPRNVSFY